MGDSLHAGHYKAFVAGPGDDDKWVCADDAATTKVGTNPKLLKS